MFEELFMTQKLKANVLFQPSTISCITVSQKNEEDKPSHGE
jgi:hypothetical protein